MNINTNKVKKIGIDIGRVIIKEDTDNPGLFFSEKYLETSPVENSFKSIVNIIDMFGKENVYLVSKCGEKTQKKTIEWLHHKKFFETTGVFPENVYFCRERKEKKDICLKYGITFFIDDRYTVLKYILEIKDTELILFQPTKEEKSLFEESGNKDKIKECWNWDEVVSNLKNMS